MPMTTQPKTWSTAKRQALAIRRLASGPATSGKSRPNKEDEAKGPIEQRVSNVQIFNVPLRTNRKGVKRGVRTRAMATIGMMPGRGGVGLDPRYAIANAINNALQTKGPLTARSLKDMSPEEQDKLRAEYSDRAVHLENWIVTYTNRDTKKIHNMEVRALNNASAVVVAKRKTEDVKKTYGWFAKKKI